MKILMKLRSNIHSLEDVILLFHILVMAGIIPIMTRHLSILRLMNVFTPKKVIYLKNIEEQKRKIVKYTDFVLGFCPLIWKQTCLKRSLILFYFLKKFAIDVRICFGTRYSNKIPKIISIKNIEGHAWLMHNGKIVLEKNIEMTKTFTMTYVFP